MLGTLPMHLSPRLWRLSSSHRPAVRNARDGEWALSHLAASCVTRSPSRVTRGYTGTAGRIEQGRRARCQPVHACRSARSRPLRMPLSSARSGECARTARRSSFAGDSAAHGQRRCRRAMSGSWSCSSSVHRAGTRIAACCCHVNFSHVSHRIEHRADIAVACNGFGPAFRSAAELQRQRQAHFPRGASVLTRAQQN